MPPLDTNTATTLGVALLIILRIVEWFRDQTQNAGKREDHTNDQIMAQFRLSTEERRENLATINTLAGILASGFSNIERMSGIQSQILENFTGFQKTTEKTASTLRATLDSVEAIRLLTEQTKRLVEAHVTQTQPAFVYIEHVAELSKRNESAVQALGSRLDSLIARLDQRIIPIKLEVEPLRSVAVEHAGE